MNIYRRVLTKEVRVSGPNFLGFKSEIAFVPMDKPGWYFLVKDKNGTEQAIPIDYKIALSKFGTIQIKYENHEMDTYEHLGVLRFLGIDGVGIRKLSKSKWIPYLGGADAFYKQLSDYLKITGELIPRIEPKMQSEWQYPGKNRFVQIIPSIYLRLKVSAQWEPFPRHYDSIQINEGSRDFLIEKVLPAKPQGYPSKRYHAAKIASFFGWPNFNNITWPKDLSPQEFSYQCWLHRVQDQLGGLSLVDHMSLPTGMCMYSYDAGHKGDLEALKKSF